MLRSYAVTTQERFGGCFAHRFWLLIVMLTNGDLV